MDWIRELLRRRNADGGWGAGPGGASNTECTALAALALRDEAGGAGALRWLASRQTETGAWPFSVERPAAGWPTPLALLALGASPVDAQEAAAARGFDWLLAQRGRSYHWMLRLWHRFFGRRRIDVDVSLIGWPWVSGTTSSVEPTGWALLALKTRWPDRRPRGVSARIEEAEAMLADRSCHGGGWNYGMKQVFDEKMPPYPDTTAVALLGLHGPGSPLVDAGFEALDQLLREGGSPLSLALAILAGRTWGRETDALRQRLELDMDERMPDDTRSLALAVLATAPLRWPGAA